jgi:hypothetical protein
MAKLLPAVFFIMPAAAVLTTQATPVEAASADAWRNQVRHRQQAAAGTTGSIASITAGVGFSVPAT